MSWIYTYCPECEEPQRKPTAGETIADTYSCCDCGEKLFISPEDKEYLIDDLVERIEAIETQLGVKR